MANSFFRLTDFSFNNIECPAPVLKKWNVPDKPTEDEDGNKLDVTPYTIREALDSANLGSAPYFPIVHTDGEAPVKTDEDPTHWIIPLNNVGGIIDAAVMPIAGALGVGYEEVKLAHDEAKHYLSTGELPK